MKRTSATLLALTALLAPASFAAEANDAEPGSPTFYADVLPILQDNCQVCHRPNGANLGGMVAPMAFTSYAETRPWARSIARQVDARTMPPWHASRELHGVFENERTISDDQIGKLVAWAEAGAPAGDPADAPPQRAWGSPDGWTIGEPDLVLDMGVDYFVEDDVEDQYITFTTTITEDQLAEPRWVRGVEFRPGSSVVHHIIARPLGGIAPGNDPTWYHEGYGTKLEPGTEIRWQMHYHKESGEGTGVSDRSLVALKFYPEGYVPEHVVVTDPLARFDFEIPAGDSNYTSVTSTKFERDSILLGYTPHMHLRAKSARYVAKHPDGTQEVLLDVPRYDFNWQTHYEYPADGKAIPAGTEIELTMSWDNSADNPSNPDPGETVVYGGPTTSEMMFGFVSYTDAEAGYQPPAGAGFLGRRQQIDPERLKSLVKERFGVNWDDLSEEQQGEILRRLRSRARSSQSGG